MEQLLPVAEAAEVVLGIEPETANVINSAGQAADDPVLTDQGAKPGHGALDKTGHVPVRFQLADAEKKITQYLLTLGRMGHFRVKLDTEQSSRPAAHGRHRGIPAVGDNLKTGRG